jgi:hypothetical protein
VSESYKSDLRSEEPSWSLFILLSLGPACNPHIHSARSKILVIQLPSPVHNSKLHEVDIDIHSITCCSRCSVLSAVPECLLGNIVHPGECSLIGSLRRIHGLLEIALPQHEKLGHVGKTVTDALGRMEGVGSQF